MVIISTKPKFSPMTLRFQNGHESTFIYKQLTC